MGTANVASQIYHICLKKNMGPVWEWETIATLTVVQPVENGFRIVSNIFPRLWVEMIWVGPEPQRYQVKIGYEKDSQQAECWSQVFNELSLFHCGCMLLP